MITPYLIWISLGHILESRGMIWVEYIQTISPPLLFGLTVFRKGKQFVWDNFYRPTTFSIEYNAIPV